jgi:hypothetical protein
VLHATASIGVSVIVDPAQDLAKLITLADQALHLAKSRARNRVEAASLEVSFGNEMSQQVMMHAPEHWRRKRRWSSEAHRSCLGDCSRAVLRNLRGGRHRILANRRSGCRAFADISPGGGRTRPAWNHHEATAATPQLRHRSVAVGRFRSV